MQRAEWALYRVRRYFHAPASAWRSIDILHRGDHTSATTQLDAYARRAGRRSRVDDGHQRLWLADRATTNSATSQDDRLSAGRRPYPQLEEFLVAAPAQAQEKARPRFEHRWASAAPAALLAVEAELGLRTSLLIAA